MDPNDGRTLIVKKEEDCKRQKWIQTRGNLSMVEDKKKDSYSCIRIQMERVYLEGLRKAATNLDNGYPERDGGAGLVFGYSSSWIYTFWLMSFAVPMGDR